jgi:hypothetical protein
MTHKKERLMLRARAKHLAVSDSLDHEAGEKSKSHEHP